MSSGEHKYPVGVLLGFFARFGRFILRPVNTVTGEVVLPFSLTWHLLTGLGGSNNSRHPRRTA